MGREENTGKDYKVGKGRENQGRGYKDRLWESKSERNLEVLR